MDAKENEEIRIEVGNEYMPQAIVDEIFKRGNGEFYTHIVKEEIKKALDTKDKRIKELELLLNGQKDITSNLVKQIGELEETIEVLSDGTGARVLKEEVERLKRVKPCCESCLQDKSMGYGEDIKCCCIHDNEDLEFHELKEKLAVAVEGLEFARTGQENLIELKLLPNESYEDAARQHIQHINTALKQIKGGGTNGR